MGRPPDSASPETGAVGEAGGSGERPPLPRVLLGVDRLLRDPEAFPAAFRPGTRVGLVTSDGAPTGPKTSQETSSGEEVDPAGRPASPGGIFGSTRVSVRGALRSAGVPLVRLFSPEHGLSASSPDGRGVADGIDPETGLPVISLYGPRLAPPHQALADLDLLLFDLQDVGARFYTFLWTLSHLMEACGSAGVPLWVLDRPNPLGGEEGSVEGPVPDTDAPSSFLGRWPLPIRHSLTLGELSLLLRREMGLGVDLSVVALEGWERGFHWPATRIPFHPPSPGIPTYESALLYPGLALLEATNVRMGRSTPLAFRWMGAPWLDARRMAEALNDEDLPGIRAHPRPLAASSTPDPCPGIALEVTDPSSVRPVALGLRALSLLAALFPDDFAWRPYPTLANPTGEGHLGMLLGSGPWVRSLEADPSSVHAAAIRRWTQAPGWWVRTAPCRLYL